MKSRIVFDTSTLVGAALRSNSTPRRALRLALATHELCLSQFIAEELETVFARPRLLNYASEDVFRAFVGSLRSESRFYVLSAAQVEGILPSCRDPKDNHVLALAQIANADCIICSDKDLIALHPWHGIPIYAPATFLNQFGEKTSS